MLPGRYQHKKYLFYFYDYCVSLLLSHMNIVLEYEMNFPCKNLASWGWECNFSDCVLCVHIWGVDLCDFDSTHSSCCVFFYHSQWKKNIELPCHERLLTDYFFWIFHIAIRCRDTFFQIMTKVFKHSSQTVYSNYY